VIFVPEFPVVPRVNELALTARCSVLIFRRKRL